MTFKEIIKNLSDLPQKKQQGVFDLAKNRCGGDIRKITPADLDAARAEYMQDAPEEESIHPETQEQTPRSLDEEMEDIYRLCARGLDEYMQQVGIEDWKKETLTRWRGACEYIGRTVFKPGDILRDTTRREYSGCTYTTNHMIDREKLEKLLVYYAELCHRHGKPVMLAHFCDFCGIGYSDYVLRAGELSPASMAIFKSAFELQHSDLTDRAVQGGGVTLIATLNHVHGWDGSRQQVKEDKISQLSVDSLPRLGGGGA